MFPMASCVWTLVTSWWRCLGSYETVGGGVLLEEVALCGRASMSSSPTSRWVSDSHFILVAMASPPEWAVLTMSKHYRPSFLLGYLSQQWIKLVTDLQPEFQGKGAAWDSTKCRRGLLHFEDGVLLEDMNAASSMAQVFCKDLSSIWSGSVVMT